jgi:hypothetical protein
MNVRKYLSNVRDYDTDDVLGVLGLQRRTGSDWVFPMLAGLGAGMAIGAGIAFFLTPYKGEEAREKFIKGATDAQKLLSERIATLSDKINSMNANDGASVSSTSGASTPAARIGAGTGTTGTGSTGIGNGTGLGTGGTGGTRSY